jgi:NADH:ubiquinone oxidoreductase subunit 5 (subunit L)/multisubunit Na+/H+ antiporter MnhA subunit
VQNDIKKIIAYSTCSQLGYMIAACGMSYYNISLFHLYAHAFFKALSFLSAGSIIHILQNEQDIRKMGSLLSTITPFTYIAMSIASLALAGFPFFAGFYSKDFIIEISYFSNRNIFVVWLLLFSAVLTVIYSIRLLDQVF